MMKQMLTLIACLAPLFIFGANFTDLPTEVVQPDGTTLHLLASGDEYANRLHDAQGYSIIQSPDDGYYYYATLLDDEPVASSWRADSSNPAAVGLRPGINISQARYQEKVQQMNSHNRAGSRTPNTGTVNNLVVYIRFSDQTEFSDPRSTYDLKFNAPGTEDYSLRNYFQQVSYGQLDYVSHHFPTCAPEINLSYQDSHPRSYFMPYNSLTNPQGYRDYQRTEREQQLLADAIEAVTADIPVELNIDADNDGYVDNVCFIIRGPHTAWAELLWAHRWVLYDVESFIHGKMVWDFTFQPENQNTVRTLCHEMFHSVGAPDLYHYEFDGMTPAGCWDIMESGAGHMGMYMKAKYGLWIPSIPSISYGTHTLEPVTSATNSAYKIDLGGDEFLVLEYRKQGSDIFEMGLPGSGLLIYRINDAQEGNAQGPPDEVYVFRPNGTASTNGLIAEAAFSAQNYQTEFNQYTNPRSFLTNGNSFSVNIRDISLAGETITFTYAASQYPPAIADVSPMDGTVLVSGDYQLSASISAPGSIISTVDFYCDGQLLGSVTNAPFSQTLSSTYLSPGYHDLVITATSQNGLFTSEHSRIRVVDPLQQTWFSWLSSEPVWSEFGRGSVPIKTAIDLDLGTQEYVVKKIAFSAIADTWGLPENPGLVNVTINRFLNNAITDQVLLDIGDLMHPMDGRQEYIVNSVVPLSGKIAVVLDLSDYQNIVFDTSAPCGHSWLTEPDRPWTDALGRGMLGSAAIELLLQAPNVACDDPIAPALIEGLASYPNPFASETSIAFSIKSPQVVNLAIYNLKGQKVRELVSATLPAGDHGFAWDGRDESSRQVASGVYLYHIQVGKHSISGRMAYINR